MTAKMAAKINGCQDGRQMYKIACLDQLSAYIERNLYTGIPNFNLLSGRDS